MKKKSWHAWWAAPHDTFPHWAGVVNKLLVTQPSSASADRVFSLLKNAFNDQQEGTTLELQS